MRSLTSISLFTQLKDHATSIDKMLALNSSTKIFFLIAATYKAFNHVVDGLQEPTRDLKLHTAGIQTKLFPTTKHCNSSTHL